MSPPKLELAGVTKLYGGDTIAAVDGIDLAVEAGETIALLGSSGCGKSTTLNMIVGLEQPSAGDIRIDGRSVLGVPAGARDVGLVFQDYAVFTHMSVRQNLAFGLAVRRAPKAEIARAVAEVADLLGMADRLDARAGDLGGSELQRVAIGRTLVTRPAVLLLDEPLSNLEAAARLAMRRELRRLQREVGLTIIYVTHDQVEALSLADRVAVMNAGKIRQIAPASVICERPDHVFVAAFMGSPPMNLLRGRLVGEGSGSRFTRGDLTVVLGLGAPAGPPGSAAFTVLGIRPDALRLVAAPAAALRGRVALVEPRGPEAVVTVDVDGESLKLLTPASDRPVEGAPVGVAVDQSMLVLFDGETGRRLAA